MKRLLFILVTALLTVATCAAANNDTPLTFAETNHEFGNIKSTDGKVSCEFKFTNTSKNPVVVVMVTNGGCGCTKPSYPRKPVAPGKTEAIKITFDPTGRRGEFNREVKVRYQSGKDKFKTALTFSGNILP